MRPTGAHLAACEDETAVRCNTTTLVNTYLFDKENYLFDKEEETCQH
jgi:hypothetical protein